MENLNKKELVKPGEILIVQGQVPRFIYYLHSGAIEILSSPKEFEGLDPAIIAQKGKRVGLIREEVFISGLNLEFTDPSTKSVRVVEDSYISRHPVNNGGIIQFVREDPANAITMLNHLFKRLELAVSDESSYTNFYTNICRINDNFSLMYCSLPKCDLSDKLKSRSESLYEVFVSNKGNLSGSFDAKFLVSDNSRFLRKRYTFPGLSIQSIIEPRQCSLVKKFLKLDKKVLLGIIKEDPSILQNMIETISDNLIKVLDRIYAEHNEIDSELGILFGPAGWSSYLVESRGFNTWADSGRISSDFINNFLTLIKKLHSYYQKISGKNLIDLFPGPKMIHGYYVSAKGPAKTKDEDIDYKTAPKAASINTAGGIYNNSLRQIFEFALVDKDFQKTFTKAINDFKTMNNPFSTETEGRKIRRAITRHYWDLFSQVYIRQQKEKKAPAPVNLMMKFGFLDESLLDEEQVDELHELSSVIEELNDIPTLYEEEFLGGIYKGNINPSITDMGLSYEAFKREEAKKGKRVAPSGAGGDEIDKIIYEIHHRLAHTVAVCSGSTATAFPILTSMIMKISPKNIFMSKTKLHNAIRELMDIDFSVFYRETTLKLDNARELIQEEVIPNFILLPSFGTKTMLWQDLDGTNRRTRGRIVVPILFMGDIIKNMAHTFANFRWELNRTLKGGLWADPVEGGFTGAYFDYINFYKKNSKLSVETKDKITERFKSLRTNRDRFADDYVQWLLYEKDGIMRLNTVVREIFYRYIPFKKDMRTKLEGMPAFAEIANRYKNITSKSIESYERRFKKYMDEYGALPGKLQEFMDFLNM